MTAAPRTTDPAAFRMADHEGFLSAFVDGEMAAGISVVRTAMISDSSASICRPDMRGHGYGKAVSDAGMARLTGQTVGLDGVPSSRRITAA